MEEASLIVGGLFAIVCSIAKPRIFWEHRKAVSLRNSVGDKNATMFYIAIGTVAIIMGIVFKLMS